MDVLEHTLQKKYQLSVFQIGSEGIKGSVPLVEHGENFLPPSPAKSSEERVEKKVKLYNPAANEEKILIFDNQLLKANGKCENAFSR